MQKRPESDKSNSSGLSRLEEFTRDGIEPVYPPCSAFYLFQYLTEIGPCNDNGQGLYPISQQDIQAYQVNTGIELNAWETKTLRLLSVEYRNQHNKAQERNCPPPFSNEIAEQRAQDAFNVQFESFISTQRVITVNRE